MDGRTTPWVRFARETGFRPLRPPNPPVGPTRGSVVANANRLGLAQARAPSTARKTRNSTRTGGDVHRRKGMLDESAVAACPLSNAPGPALQVSSTQIGFKPEPSESGSAPRCIESTNRPNRVGRPNTGRPAMKRYELKTPRAASVLAAAVLTVLTIGIAVVWPARAETDLAHAAQLAAVHAMPAALRQIASDVPHDRGDGEG